MGKISSSGCTPVRSGAAHAALLLLFVAMFVSAVSAQEHFSRRLWQVADGLPSDVVQAFSETPDHALWIGTTGGLVRFDGEHFSLFDQDNTPALTADSIFCLTVTKDGTLWIGIEGGGLVRYRDGQFHAFGKSDGLSDPVVRAILEDPNGSLWVGTDHGLYRMQGNRFSRVDDTKELPALSVHTLTLTRDGDLWVGGTALVRLHDGGREVQAFTLPLSGSSMRIKTIMESTDRTLWVGAVSGLYRLADGKFVAVPQIRRTVRVLRQTHDGTVWIGTIGNGLYTLGPNGIPHKFAGGPPSQSILNLFEDVEHNIWVASQVGMERLSPSSITLLRSNDSSDADFGTVFQDHDGSVWMCSNHLFRQQADGLLRVDNPPVRAATIRNMLRASDGSLWIGTEGSGLFRLRAGRVERFSTREGLVNNFIRSLIEDRDGSLWVGTDSDLDHIQRGQ